MKTRWKKWGAAFLRLFRPDTRKPLAVLTMVYNEHRMLPLWADYYRRQAGAGNIFVLDHGSDALPALPGCEVIPVPRGEVDEIDRCAQVEAFQKQLLKTYRYVLFTDCDEFLVADPARYSSLLDYVERAPAPSLRCVGVDVIDYAPDLPPVQWDKPILAQRSYGAVRFWSCKTLLSSVPLTWQPGFHACEEPAYLDTDLWMFHLKYADQHTLLERLNITRHLRWSERALTLEHGASHRMADRTMVNFIRTFQATRSETSLGDLDLAGIINAGAESGLHRIPERFLKAF
ncbi:glycosyltransferase family 2 protein [Acetobacter farinalis]|uniref:Glycosyltransferase family 2 protein n=1 Tax=Acetobacter farinalis TaxID=1260984 RepID=A0ABT3Q7L2_9PROT|nr:glycosyltransferase family 2 protein [Acetobacter farinalis]MCX2561261.1 glycosyltransferase family 2 protein [Acetobacter farinalis]